MPDLDVADLARTLENTSRNLDRHIKTEAQKRAAELGKTYAKAADERIRDNAADMQRLQDLVAELRRQMKPLTRDAYNYHALKKRVLELAKLAEDAGDAGPAGMLRTAINEAQAAFERNAMDIPDKLAALHAETHAVFEALHAANDDAHQQNPDLRQAVAQASAAVAALEKAARCAEAAFETADQ